MKTTWLHSMVQGDATQYYRKRNGIMVEHMVRPANFDMRYNHFHQEYEIYLLLRRRRQMFFENRAYEAQAGNLILVDSGQIHMSHSIVGDPEGDHQARTLGGTGDALADTRVTALESYLLAFSENSNAHITYQPFQPCAGCVHRST